MIPPTWKTVCCHKCQCTELDSIGFCKNCGEAAIFSLSKEKSRTISLAIARWSSRSPSSQVQRCMACGKMGTFPITRSSLPTSQKLASFFVKDSNEYKQIAETYYDGDPPEMLAQALINKEQRIICEVSSLPENLKELKTYTSSPVLCLDCMIEASALPSKEEEESPREIAPEPNLYPQARTRTPEINTSPDSLERTKEKNDDADSFDQQFLESF